MTNDKKVLTPEELSKELGVSLRLVYRQIKNGTIPHVRLGDRYFIGAGWLEKVRAGEITANG